MDQLLNQLPQDDLRHISWRGIALIVIGILAAVSFLMYVGGFNVVARIFGSKAGTDSQFLFAGVTNFENRTGAAEWLVPETQPSLDGTGAFTSFTGVPDYMVPDSLEAGLIMPLVTSLTPGEDAFTNHRFTSAPINFGQTGVITNTIKLYAHLSDEDRLIFGYKTADAVEDLKTAELHALTPTFTALDSNPDISSADITLDREFKQYFQLTVSFDTFDPSNRPVVYGWVVDYGQTVVETTSATKAKVTLTYSGGPAIPTDATLTLLGAELALNPLYTETHIDLTQSNQRAINLDLSPGAYTIEVTSPTTKTKLVPFLVEEGDEEMTVRLEAFEAGTNASADLNGDGKVNSIDAQILFGQYGLTS